MQTRLFRAPSGASIRFTALGQGTAPLGNLYRAVSEAQAQTTLEAAWRAGIRYFDTAPLYGFGLAETRLNHFLRGKPRDGYAVSTKVGRRLVVAPFKERSGIGKFFETPSRREFFDYSYDGIMRSLEDSLERLGLDRVDILYAHDLDVFTHGSTAARDTRVDEFMKGGYKALLKLRETGVIKAFGAGVNEWQVCQMLADRGAFDLFLLAGRYTLLEQTALDSFLPLCDSRGIGVVIGGPYNSGILASGAKPGAFYNYAPAPKAVLDRVRRIERVCRAHGVTLVEAALRFPFGHPSVVSVIPGAVHAQEVVRNLRTLRARVPRALWTDLKAAGLVREDAPIQARER
jgi:D-threo-aldose 1-dehydrogenase